MIVGVKKNNYLLELSSFGFDGNPFSSVVHGH